mmetsp:Transcript_4233/g.9575  ORF Transcript_4233/g.9575 Transcript_4233/m.9575 type:complete len:240 (-) Transcript_4233:475-1194(-)
MIATSNDPRGVKPCQWISCHFHLRRAARPFATPVQIVIPSRQKKEQKHLPKQPSCCHRRNVDRCCHCHQSTLSHPFISKSSSSSTLPIETVPVTASITIGSEYIGKVAVADGKEIAANTIQCAAEAEALLANAERVKAITPLCVGAGATAASLSLLAPTIIEALNIGNSVQFVTELYLFCPLVSVLAAAVANLALEETRGFATRAINIGVRRFAKSGLVERKWLSSSEQVQKNSKSKTD